MIENELNLLKLIKENKRLFEKNDCMEFKNPYIKEYPSPIYNTSNPCINCPNNPMNNPFASGFCNCILGNNIIY